MLPTSGLLQKILSEPWLMSIAWRKLASAMSPSTSASTIGAYTVNNSMFDVWLMLAFGVLGYLFKKLKYPLAPLVLALVLGDMAEASFRQSMLISQGSLAIFWANPLVASIAGIAIVLLLWPLLGTLRARMKAGESSDDGGSAR